MSYTPAAIRKLVDDLDNILRAAVLDGTIEQRYAQERKKVVSVILDIYIHMYNKTIGCSHAYQPAAGRQPRAPEGVPNPPVPVVVHSRMVHGQKDEQAGPGVLGQATRPAGWL